MADISIEEYNFISHVVKGYSGLDLGPDKKYLILSRLAPLLPKFGFATITDMLSAMKNSEKKNSLIKVVSEALATHESLFFRDKAPFQYLSQTILPKLCSAPGPLKKIRIWSAACSIGQEPYSIAFSLHEARTMLSGLQTEILATDFSSYAIERAKKGVYSQFEAQRGLSSQQIKAFFDQIPETKEVQVRESFRKQVEFREQNFMHSFAGLGVFDVIFCRNVLIYFTPEMKKQIIERMSQILKPDGYLILGNTESIVGITDSLQRAKDSQCSVFEKKAPSSAISQLRKAS